MKHLKWFSKQRKMNTLWIFAIILVLVLLILLFAFPSKKSDPPTVPFVSQQLRSTNAVPTKEQLPQGPSKVIELQTNEDVEKFTTSEGPGILLVYAPWCGHCKHMMPAYDSASVQTNVKFARVEGSKVPAMMNKHQIRGFPTILVVNANQTVTRHMGGRDVSSLLSAAALAASTVSTPPSEASNPGPSGGEPNT